MSIVSVEEQFQPSRFLVITNLSDPSAPPDISTTRILISDQRVNSIGLISVEKGPQGDQGLVGPQGPPGKDGLIFDVLPIASGGTNNISFVSGCIVAYDGLKLASTSYTISDILSQSQNSNAITGIIAGSGLSKNISNTNEVTINTSIGEGLDIINNQIVVDSSIARTAELSLGSIQGVVPISKGGTNNSLYSVNKLVYYDGTKITSFPLNTGSIVVSGSKITITAGSGLIGGGELSLPTGSIVLNIPSSADIFVDDNSISLTTTGVPGTYSKITTDNKGRVISGDSLSLLDIVNILGYVPWHSGNDGAGSLLDADLLDGEHGSFYRDSANLTGTISQNILPNLHETTKTGTKFVINTKGLIETAFSADSNDIISSLGYTPLDASNDSVKQGSLSIIGSLITSAGDVSFYDNLPLFGTNRQSIQPAEPRGFTFNYGGIFSNRTGILAYYPGDNQLKLITNVYGSGTDIDGDGDSDYQDDINGGDAESIYILQNLEGETRTVLFREIADSLYVTTNTAQDIIGLKRFLSETQFYKKIRILDDGQPPTTPPIDVGNNNLNIPNLNSDLLDDHHGSYYRDASNITGSFSYSSVSFDHIQGEYRYIAKFNDTNDPSQTINSSNILQRSDGDIQTYDNANLIVGPANNTLISSENNTIIGVSNTGIETDGSLIVGNNNLISGLYSLVAGRETRVEANCGVAINRGSLVTSDNSFAAGSYGIASNPNQFAFGAFKTLLNGETIEHGQYSTIAAYLRGTETQGSWVSLYPVIRLPKDKTIAYNIELLINKGLSSGVAHFSFSSGIINNATFRDPSNITQIINRTTVPNSGAKSELYNNSQLRRHYHFWKYKPSFNDSQTVVVQHINCESAPIKSNNLDLRHIKTHYFYNPEQVSITGFFEKDHRGSLILDINKPRFSGDFVQNSLSPNIRINTSGSQVVLDSLVDINFLSSSQHFIPSGRYRGLSSDNNGFFIEPYKWKGTKTTENNITKIKIFNTLDHDSLTTFSVSGYVSTNTIFLESAYNNNYKISNILKPDTNIKLLYANLAYNRVVVSVDADKIIINHPLFSTGNNPVIINDNVQIIFDEYSYNTFKSCDSIVVNNENVSIKGGKTYKNARFFPDNRFNFVQDSGAGTASNPVTAQISGFHNSGILVENDAYDRISFSILVDQLLDNIQEGDSVEIKPVFSNNTGYLELYKKSNFDCKYNAFLSDTNVITGVYIRELGDSLNKISIFDRNNTPVNFISNPAVFGFASGFGSENNLFFDIEKINNHYFLRTKKSFNYEENNLIPIKVYANSFISGVADYYEQYLYISINNVSEKPYVIKTFEPTGIPTDNLFLLDLSGVFLEQDTNDSISISASVRGSDYLPRWLHLDTTTLLLSGVPDICDIGSYSIDIKAQDNQGLFSLSNIIIHVSGNNVFSLEGSSYNTQSILNIQNIYLTNSAINENLPSGSLIGEIKHIGGYNPYIRFLTAQNNFSGIFTYNSDLVRNCLPNILAYSGFTISGTPEKLSVGSLVNTKFSNQLSDVSGIVKNVYRPSVFSGTPCWNDKIIFHDPITDYTTSILYTGQKLPSDMHSIFDSKQRLKYIDDYSIDIGLYIVQEISLDLLLTEDNYAILYEKTLSTNNYFLNNENGSNILSDPDALFKLKYSDHIFPDNIVWSEKYNYANIVNEDLDFISISSGNESANLISEQINNTEIIFDNIYSNDPIRIRRSIHDSIGNIFTDSIVYRLTALTKPRNSIKYISSNIDYLRPFAELYNPKDHWTFFDAINNGNIYLHYIGSDDNAHFVTEQRFDKYDDEYGLLLTEDGFNGLISDTKTDHGSRLEMSTRYELLDEIGAYSNNGLLVSESFFDIFLCENNDRLVHDYGITCQESYINILFPGIRNHVSINYPKTRSYSSNRLRLNNFFHGILCENEEKVVSENNEFLKKNNPPIGLYEDILENTPNNLSFTEPNFYYTWGQLIPYPMYTNEYVVRLSSNHPYSGSRSGTINYDGESPSSGNYYPDSFYDLSFNMQSGYCPESYSSGGYIGFETTENSFYTRKYVTGIVEFYTDFASQFIDVFSAENIHKDSRTEDYIHLYGINTTTPNSLVPRYGLYNEYKILSSSGLRLENYLLMPPSATINHTGVAKLNIDRNHKQDIKDSKIINDIPIKFLTVLDSNQNRLPKNNIFDIKHISGHKIYIDDNKNYTLKNTSYPDYFDHAISSRYITNGIQFLGSLFHNNTNIYDIREDIEKINHLYENVYFNFDKQNNELILSIPKNSIRIFDRIQISNLVPATNDLDWSSSVQIDTIGFTVFPQNLIKNPDPATYDKYFVLLESSKPQASNYSDKLIFKTNIFPKNTFGSCSINNLLPNRFDEGYILNYSLGSGHRYLSYTSGYSFTGIIPKNNNIISSNQMLNDDRIGFSSVINTGTLPLLSGVRSVRFASNYNDIGYSETYLVSRSGFKNNEFLNSGISGVGSTNNPYSILVKNTGSPYSSRFLEFLYLGHNDNTITLSGNLITSGINELSITKITIEDTNEIDRLKKLNIVSGVTPVIITGTNNIVENIDYQINVKRLDRIQIKLDSSYNTYQNTLSLNISANQAIPAPLILDHEKIINTGEFLYPLYNDISTNLFYILPTIHTNSKYCNLSDTYRKNKEIFYNGNIINLYQFDSIKSFLNKYDNFRVLSFNNINVQSGSGAMFVNKINPTEEYYSITGITKQGDFSIPSSIYPYLSSDLLEDHIRQSSPFGTHPASYLSNSGYASIVGYHSGTFEALLDNNISIQSYGESTSYWPQNSDGVIVQPPLTGLYSISDNTFSCSSGRLCVVITGYKNTNFNSISFNKDYYLDFSDGFAEANGIYRIKDKLSPTVFSVDTPYNSTNFSKSGIVYIIDSKYNIKSHLNPNSGNLFISPQPTTTLTLPFYRIDKFDTNTKKWTHTYNLAKNIENNNIDFKFNIANTGYDSSIIKNNFSQIKISNISVISNIDTTPEFSEVIQNSGIEIYTDTNSILLRVQTSGGFPEIKNRLINTPRVSISGSASYGLRKSSISQDLWGYTNNSGWSSVVEIAPFAQTGNFPMVLSVKDETGTDSFVFSLNVKERPSIDPVLITGYSFVIDNFWKMYFDTRGIDLISNNPGNQGMSITNIPTNNYSFLRLSDSSFIVSGTGLMSTGIYTPVVSIFKLNTSNILASGSGNLSIVNSLNDRPQYTPQVNKFASEEYVDITKFENLFYYVPVYELGPDGIIPSLNGGIYFNSIVDSNTFDSSVNRYTVEFLPRNTGSSTYLSESIYAPNRTFNFTIKQPIYTNGSPSYISYTSNNYVQNITFYKPISIDTSYINTIPIFKLNRPWSIQFVVNEGLTKHRSDTPPRVSLYNAPGLGSLNYQYLNYSLSYQYDSTNKYWIVTAAGKPDQYGNYVPSTGLYTVDIFVDDKYASYSKAQMSFEYTSFNKIDYILPNVYATPNNEFFINADVDEPFDSTEPIIEFEGENSVGFDYSSSYKKYNPKFNIWEISVTGNKLVDKWDSRIILNTNQAIDNENGPTITIQAKGIATDKITAVAKIDLLELKNTNSDILLERLPIKITGISGGDEKEWTPESGIEVNQGSKGWKLAFKTIRGLESPNHPPTIILEDMPTFCTGYDPRLDPAYSLDNPVANLQNSCLIEGPTYSEDDSSWSFLFSGLPSCILDGPQGFSITAIDTDLTLVNPYIEPSDRVDTLFSYKPIEEDHPGPAIVAIEEEGVTNTIIKPKCNTQYYLQLKFGPSARSECPAPTGLTGFYFSGSLPSGLSYSYSYPVFSQTNTFNSPIYNNLGSGIITIQGYPEEFAPQGSDTYEEEFGIIAIDARNKTGIYVLNFSQTVDINEPDMGLRVFFDSAKPVFTPKTGLAPIEATTIDTYRPEAAAYNLVCRSILPNNNCPASGIKYSGLPDIDNYMALLPSGSNSLGISSGDFIYLDINDININDKYLVQRSNGILPFSSFPSGRLYITTNVPFSTRTGTATVVVEKFKNVEIDDMSELFFGSYTNKCVLGNGLLDRDRSPNAQQAKIGIRGFISPSLSGYLSPTGFWNANDIRLTGLNMSALSNDTYTEIPYIDCWQTGYLRISGILLPKIYTDITDPPPGASAPFTANGSSFVLNTRLAYGDTEIERSINANRRGGKTAHYEFINLRNNTTGLVGSVGISTTNQQAIVLNGTTLESLSNGSGAVFKFSIRSSGDNFPNYSYNSLPASQTGNYYWVHKASAVLSSPVIQSTFPPIIPCEPNNINIISGQIINFNNSDPDYGIDGFAYGGYVAHSGTQNDNWSSRSYLPIISGLIIKNLNKTSLKLNSYYDHSNQRLSIFGTTNKLFASNLISISISKQNINNLTLIETFNTGLITADFSNDGSSLLFSKNYGTESFNAIADIQFINSINSIDTNSHILNIRHNNLSLSTGDMVIIDYGEKSSSLNNIGSNNIFSVIEKTSTGLSISGYGSQPSLLYDGFSSGIYIDIHQHIEDNIKIMPSNIRSDEDSRYDFIISGRANILYGFYYYRILTKENINAPIFSILTPKSYFKDIPLHVYKPIEIIDTITNWSGSSWTVVLKIKHGRLPALSEIIDVQIDVNENGNYSYCGFDRFPSGSISDSYDEDTEITTISLSSNDRGPWSNINETSFVIKVSDSTGFDTVTILKT